MQAGMHALELHLEEQTQIDSSEATNVEMRPSDRARRIGGRMRCKPPIAASDGLEAMDAANVASAIQVGLVFR